MKFKRFFILKQINLYNFVTRGARNGGITPPPTYMVHTKLTIKSPEKGCYYYTERNGKEHLVPWNTYSTERLKNKLRQLSTLDLVF